MDPDRIDALTLMVNRLPSRRHVFRGLAGLCLGALQLPDPLAAKKLDVDAEKKHKRKA